MKKFLRPIAAGIALLLGIAVIATLSYVLPQDGKAAEIILDRQSTLFPYPFTIQNLMIIIFFLGLGELWVRWHAGSSALAFTRKHYLPEDDRTVLQSHDLGPLRQKVLPDLQAYHAFLPNLINRCILQFLSSRSIDGTNSILNSLSDIYFHQIELKYSILRYIAWVIPVWGFIGTVVGIAASLKVLSGDMMNLDFETLTGNLGVAFYTTLVALVLSAILMFFIHVVQEREEKSLNTAMEYCLSNLINRLYTAE